MSVNVRVLFRVMLLPLVLVMILVAGCSSTPEETTDTSQPVEVVPGCENAKNPQDCRIQHKKGGSDVPTVDNVLEPRP